MCGVALVLQALRSSSSLTTASAAATTATTTCSCSSAPSIGLSPVVRFGDAFEHELARKLHRRGPDHLAKLHVPLVASAPTADDANGVELSVYAAVLHLRGDALFAQPVEDAGGNVLCWNGEVFGGALGGIDVHESDTRRLADELSRVSSIDADQPQQQQRILSVLQGVHGPFAFVWLHRATQRVYFGHDRFGRRSLLYHCADAAGTSRDWFTALAADREELSGSSSREPRTTALCRDELARLCLSSVAIATADASGEPVSFGEVPANGVFVLDLSAATASEENAAYQLEFHPYPALVQDHTSFDGSASSALSTIPRDEYDCGLPSTLPAAASSQQHHGLEETANGLLVALSNAVGVRVRTIPAAPAPASAESAGQAARVGVLFSGGLDSVVLAALAHFHAAADEPIDLLNVCFDAASRFQSPDRLAAEISLAELQTLFPARAWRFVRVDVPFEDVLAQQRAIYELMTPCDTHMDFNIGAAFWFLAQARGSVSARNGATRSGVALKDLNAFLHENRAAGGAESLEAAVRALGLFASEEDAASIVCPVGNCKRKKKPGCVLGICRVCCFKVQKSVGKLLDSESHAGEKAKCTQNLSTMGISTTRPSASGGDEDNSSQLERLLRVLGERGSQRDGSQPFELECRVHRAKPLASATAESGASISYSDTTSELLQDGDVSQPYTSTARVLLVGIGADEQLGGYGRHRTAFVNGGAQGLRDELAMDMKRIWKRNLGRDDRCISSHGKEARFPFLDERVVAFVSSLPTEHICDFAQPRGEGDKLVLRLAARQLGLRNCTGLAKRAIQFGTRIAKHSNAVAFGSNRQATGDAKFELS